MDFNGIWKTLLTFLAGAAIGIVLCLQYQAIEREAEGRVGESCGLMWKQSHFRLNRQNLMDELVAQGCQDLQKAYKDAMDGSDSLRSVSCTKHNNVFGLCGEDGKYLRFRHWTESVEAYMKTGGQE